MDNGEWKIDVIVNYQPPYSKVCANGLENGGFGMVCDGSERVDEILRSAMLWDVMGGVARRSWARNAHAMETSEEFNRTHAEGYHITMPYVADEELIDKYIK